MFRLDYISCVLTILSTLLIGRRKWEGWVVAGANSVIVCVIGIRTSQLGFVPANVFCLAMYAYNVLNWRNAEPAKSPAVTSSDTLNRHTERAHVPRVFARHADRVGAPDERSRAHDRVRPRSLPAQR